MGARRVGATHRDGIGRRREVSPTLLNAGEPAMHATQNLALCGLLMVFASIGPATAIADDGSIKPSDWRVLEPDPSEKGPLTREMLKRRLLFEARGQFYARRKAIAAIKTPEDIA